MNRRFFLSNEQYLGVPGHKHLVPVTHEHTDKELGILAFCPEGTNSPGVRLDCELRRASIDHRRAGPVVERGYSRRGARRGARESLQCPTCYTTGICAAGDNHPKGPEAGFAETRRVGQTLATEAVKRAYDAHKVEGPLGVHALTRSVPLRLRTLEEFRQIPLNGDGEGDHRQLTATWRSRGQWLMSSLRYWRLALCSLSAYRVNWWRSWAVC